MEKTSTSVSMDYLMNSDQYPSLSSLSSDDHTLYHHHDNHAPPHPKEELKQLLPDSLAEDTQHETRRGPIFGAVGIPSLELTILHQSRMARHRALRMFITVVHGTIAVLTGCYTFYSFMGEVGTKKCLPPLLDKFGDPVSFNHGLLTVCNSTLCALAAVCVFSVLMSIGVNCMWNSCGMMSLHLILSTIMTLFAVFGGTMFTVHNLLWCDSLTQRYVVYPTNEGCRSAAQLYDKVHKSDNMTWYYDRLEVQQAGMWAAVPLLFITIMVYSAFIRLNAKQETQGPDVSGNFRYIILRDESTPLIYPNPPETRSSGDRPRYRQLDDMSNTPPRYESTTTRTERSGTTRTDRSGTGGDSLSGTSTNPFGGEERPRE